MGAGDLVRGLFVGLFAPAVFELPQEKATRAIVRKPQATAGNWPAAVSVLSNITEWASYSLSCTAALAGIVGSNAIVEASTVSANVELGECREHWWYCLCYGSQS